MSLVILIVVGGIIGWLASLIMKTNNQMGFFLNVVVGIVGALLGSWLFGTVLGFGSAYSAGGITVVGIFWGVLGSAILIGILKLFRVFR